MALVSAAVTAGAGAITQPDLAAPLYVAQKLIVRNSVLDRILPPSIAAAEEFGRDRGYLPLTDEGTVIAPGDLSAARACARAALEQLTFPTSSPLLGLPRASQWPAGMVGSTAYCAGYRAAVVGLTRYVVSLGVDAQLNEPLSDDGLLDMVASDEERERLGILGARIPGISWDRLLLSVKLSVYKVCFPLDPWWRNLKLADVVIDEHQGMFTADLLVPGPVADGAPLASLRGRWLAYQGLLGTAVVVSA